MLLLKFKESKGSFFQSRGGSLSDISFSRAIIIGIAQGLAIAPGVSRAGSTIATGLLLGVSKSSAAQFSFMISIPAIVGASALKLKDVDFLNAGSLYLWIGLVVAYLAGLAGLTLVIKLVHSGRMWIFSGYLFVLGGLLLLSQISW